MLPPLRIIARARRTALAVTTLLASNLWAHAPMCEDIPAIRGPSSVGAAARGPMTSSSNSVRPIAHPNGISVLSLDPKASLQEFIRGGFAVQSWSPGRVHLGHGPSARAPSSTQSRAWQDPSPSLRESILSAAGLRAAVSGWDAFAKDRLFLRAQSYTLKKLAIMYPGLPRAQLENLQAQIRNGKSKERGG